TATKEYRLVLIIDPALTFPLGVPQPQGTAVPFQIGWFNQLVVPYIDMGPVPVSMDGTKFLTMPFVTVTATDGGSISYGVVVGAPNEAPLAGDPAYSPVCQLGAVTVPAGTPPP